ncbi:hypothetical protein [Microvirga arsenatis]|uniref:Copper chaperone PCu(A)C n=1 Tax=Microvirga arsenatis TaxID=2692265 RepID=A0ABW9Z1Z8_9HYPH|nr:hypothetical protein [Microvirga arsenatis]NBJ12838.1 hypothetical protein [Microvirga arsenatis]NBJ26697.1 hypothetical protein [Microvirga arsenatis]
MIRFWKSLRIVAASVLSLVIGVLLEDVRAEEDYRITNEVVLMDVRVSLAKGGNRAQIMFQLENRSSERISFGGITVADAWRCRIVASLGNGTNTILDTIPVAPGEVLSMDGEGLWIEVDGLAGGLPSDGTIEATVNLGTAVVPISLTVEGFKEHSN